MRERIIESGTGRLVFEWQERTGGYGYQLQVAEGDVWRAVSAAGNPLVRGHSFNLYPQQVQELRGGGMTVSGQAAAVGKDGAPVCYAWQGALTPDSATGWLHVDLTLDIPATLELQMVGGYEPEVTVDLGPLPPYERGDHLWFKTGITNPTKWGDDAFGNDFPATYYYDPYLHLELLMFFDMTAMDWMGPDNIARFLNYRCGFRRRYRPQGASEVGLYADGFSGTTFPAGRQRIAYWLSVAYRGEGKDAPTEQEALVTLVRRCFDLVPPSSPWPPRATSWRDFGLGCATDMADEAHSWRRDAQGNEFILNYVDGVSPAWEEVAAARRRPFNLEQPCFESALWAAYPLAAVCQVDPAPEFARLQARLLAFMDRMLQSGRTGVLGGPTDHFAAGGTWQYVDFLEELWQVAVARGDERLQREILRAVDEVLLPLAHRTNHLFPLIFDKQSLAKAWNGDNYAVAGLFAWFMLEVHRVTAEPRYLDEARLALRVAYNLPLHCLLQEGFLTSCGVQAAHRLYTLTGEQEWAQVYEYLLSQVLRQIYWYRDLTSPESRQVNILGMFDACTPMLYAALFENIENLARLAPGLKTFAPHEGLLRLFDHARRNNFYCYPACLPDEWQTSPLKYIPHENIPLLEGPNDTPVGQEIYGAGFTFRAYLLWEAFARSDDRDVMVLNLDAYEENRLLDEPEATWHFLVFNPEAETRTTTLTFPLAVNRPARLSGGPAFPLQGPGEPLSGGRYEITLGPGETLFMQLELDGG